jgi:mannose-1-phosphate guanylyltransferase
MTNTAPSGELHAIIMAGGSGTRFWPASRAARPKHFLPLADGTSLLQAAVDRVAPVVGAARTWLITNPVLARSLDSVLPDFPAAQVLVEPEPRDTAPCAALATALVEARHPGAVLAFLPADHVIAPQERFAALLQRAHALAAESGAVVMLGVRPTHPATDYGYIERGAPIDGAQPPAYRVPRFREKPDRATAAEFLRQGTFLWNSGVFLWTTETLLAAMAASHPALHASTRAMLAAAREGDRARLDRAFAGAPKTSIDYAVMEKAPRVVVVEADLAWNDLGSFAALHAVAPPDAHGNVVSLHGGARALLEDARDCTVYGEGPRAVVVFGARDLFVVAVGDAVLVCPKDRADGLKALVRRLPEAGLGDLL